MVWSGSLGRGEPDKVPSPSSERDSKFRGPSQNSPRVTLKDDVNIAKLSRFNICSYKAGVVGYIHVMSQSHDKLNYACHFSSNWVLLTVSCPPASESKLEQSMARTSRRCTRKDHVNARTS
ncbi:hypothetical protein AVEN_961-1 [Araneus ventricosus]|uniref:Uncharacterized protein n=1 Tax=Araneus ventricosus TaxID=182803 RepID=A0A4Y2CYE0_ARAVE|nr:hypothetical protein AVEN_961-1 [Araneus ventricosus]